MLMVFGKDGKQISKFQGFILDTDFRELAKYMTNESRLLIWADGPVPIEWWFARRVKKK